jgi:hypothetical protein
MHLDIGGEIVLIALCLIVVLAIIKIIRHGGV